MLKADRLRVGKPTFAHLGNVAIFLGWARVAKKSRGDRSGCEWPREITKKIFHIALLFSVDTADEVGFECSLVKFCSAANTFYISREKARQTLRPEQADSQAPLSLDTGASILFDH